MKDIHGQLSNSASTQRGLEKQDQERRMTQAVHGNTRVGSTHESSRSQPDITRA